MSYSEGPHILVPDQQKASIPIIPTPEETNT